MNVNYLASLTMVIALFLLAYLGAGLLKLQVLFGIAIPYAALLLFIYGVIFRALDWGKSPVPFRITVTAGQQASLPWIKPDRFENPTTPRDVVVRMLLEILLFRSLFRNVKAGLSPDKKLILTLELWLWLFALAFHYSLLVVLIRHFRFFLVPVPGCITFMEALDGFLQVGVPGIMISGLVLLLATLSLFFRRLFVGQVRYISLASDYFPLLLIFAIALSGILMRHFLRVDIVAVKAFAMGLATFHPALPEGIGSIFYAHLFLASVLLAYLPFSKLMHLGGAFLSPTRNMTGNTRAVRHINPWNPNVPARPYPEYENEFREKMMAAGIPVDKEVPCRKNF